MKSLSENLKHYRLSEDEYAQIKKEMGRDLQGIEWALFSALWSEHCSYKSSRVHLKNLFTKHERVLQGPGENAGVIDLGKGEKIAFKMESHNHPSFIEPTQGAATGVGGILRDIFTMGARPIAAMDYLCFGDSKDSLTPKLLHGVVKGIGGYGNCVGVPTVNGQTTFHKSYNQNNLVNAFAAGLFRPGEEIFYGRATGPGNLIVYAGATTGRDGVHGAAMASESFDSDIEKKKPNVQIGDPFFEKLLIEACLEVMQKNLVVGLQDMGAAGLTSSTFEMAARAGTGLSIDLKKVPLREQDIGPEEILLSESQERMVLIVEPEKLHLVKDVFKKWDLECTAIGEITTGDKVKLFWGQELLTEISHIPLVEGAPKYSRKYKIPTPATDEPLNIKLEGSLAETVLTFLSHEQLTSRHWITKQYDQRVGAKTLSACEDSVAMLRLPDSGRVLTMATGCRPLLMEWDVKSGAADALILPVLQMAARGAKALAVTDCLNFGNPEKENIMGQFVASLEALNNACILFDTPIVSGNVSLYNETHGENIIPTPAVGIVGLRDSISGPKGYMDANDMEIFLLKTIDETLWTGEFSPILENKKPRGVKLQGYDSALQLQKCFLEISSFSEASQVVGKGGLIRALGRLTSGGIGLQLDFEESGRSLADSLFCERFYAAVWAVRKPNADKFRSTVAKFSGNVSGIKLGKSGNQTLVINTQLNLPLKDVHIAQNKDLNHLVESFV